MSARDAGYARLQFARKNYCKCKRKMGLGPPKSVIMDNGILEGLHSVTLTAKKRLRMQK